MLVYRALQKIVSVQTIYNWNQALMSIPRLVNGNVINFVATLRAVRTYVAHRVTGKPLVWLKTPHVFPADAVLNEFTRTVEDLLVEDGLATREQIFQALKAAGTDSAPLCLLRLGLIDEKQFTEVWARHSGLGVRFVNPYDIPEGLLRQFPETQALQLEAIPVERQNGQLIMAFREPPGLELVAQLNQQLNASVLPDLACPSNIFVGGGADNPVRETVLPILARPSNIAFARDRAYPRLLLPPSRLVIYLAEIKQSAALDAGTFLEVLGRQHATGRSLPDVIIEMGLVSAPEARRVWAQTLGCPESELEGRELDQQAYDKIGSAFWWLHRMLPVRDGKIVTATVPHPAALRWLAEQLGREPVLVAELPDALELAMKKLDLDLDPDQALLDSLVAKGWLKQGAVPDLAALRGLIADPIPKWLVLQKLVSEEQLHQTFLQTFSLPAAAQWTPEEVQRLAPVLPPLFSAQTACYCLQESNGAIGLGLCQMPSAETLRRIYQRLLGYPIFFQTLDLHDAEILRNQLAPAQT